MGRRSRYIGSVLWGTVCFLFMGVDLGSWTSAIATELSNDLGSTSSLNPASSSCNFTTLFSTRSTWSSAGEPCSQKLPFELWIYMKAEGAAEEADANHVRNECLLSRAIGVVELVTPEDWNTTIMDSAPGQLLRETKRAACYRVQSPLDFEAMCTDDQVKKVSRINAVTAKSRGHFPRKTTRRLQDTVSVAGNAHGVDALISGLEELRCQRTTGEDQTLCLMSDSFNRLGGKVALQESGDLPPDEFITIVEDLPLDSDQAPSDEGSAMTELAYDIASGANFKFNTFFEGSVAAADDIIKLASDEACDVLVDDISFGDQPGFRDGVVAQAVDEVVSAGSLYFSSAGNNRNGLKFTSEWECTSDIFGDEVNEPCDSGVASHVFNPDSTGMDRYALELDPARLSPFGNTFILHWDDDDGTSRNVIFTLWTVNDFTGNVTPLTGITSFGTAVAFIDLPPIADGDVAFITISQVFTDLENVEMRLLSWTDDIFSDFSDGSIFGQQCASSTISVAAIDVTEATGIGARFADPEVSPVESFSSRGPCYINSGNGLEERLKPVTTAANGIETSTVGFEFFFGTSASAPVAAAIATIVRAACLPREVTFTDMMEMLTDYTYTIDVISDADGEEETWGTEAGYGIISADKILGWIASNCQESCPDYRGMTPLLTAVVITPGASTTSPSVPTPAKTLIVTTSQTSLTFVPSKLSKSTPPVAPITTPPIAPPTTSPVSPPDAPPTSSPSMPAPPTSQPTTPPVTPPTTPPTTPPNTPSTMPPVASPAAPTAVPPTSLPTSTFIVPPTTPPIDPPISPPTIASSTPLTMLPIMPPTQSPTAPPTSLPIGGLVDASERALVTVTANAFSMNTLWFGCPPNGCVATNTRDGDLSTRWSCKKDLLDGTDCEITYVFEEPQDIVLMLIAFYKGDERTRVLNINLNSSPYTTIESSGKTEWLEVFELNTNHTETLALEALELQGNEWISITEVQFLVI